ncbi:hypothetical protein IQ252_25085 [Tychonema sp. LEGE 07203]|nr:hypothetical protein [Tychonema sp. LEGE 07203]
MILNPGVFGLNSFIHYSVLITSMTCQGEAGFLVNGRLAVGGWQLAVGGWRLEVGSCQLLAFLPAADSQLPTHSKSGFWRFLTNQSALGPTKV